MYILDLLGNLNFRKPSRVRQHPKHCTPFLIYLLKFYLSFLFFFLGPTSATIFVCTNSLGWSLIGNSKINRFSSLREGPYFFLALLCNDHSHSDSAHKQYKRFAHCSTYESGISNLISVPSSWVVKGSGEFHSTLISDTQNGTWLTPCRTRWSVDRHKNSSQLAEPSAQHSSSSQDSSTYELTCRPIWEKQTMGKARRGFFEVPKILQDLSVLVPLFQFPIDR